MSKKSEVINHIELKKIIPFKDHPFQVREDEEMNMLVESIGMVGVLVPIIVRPIQEDKYELISGHRRTHACEMLGYSSIPAIIRDIDRDEAIVMMVDSNYQREEILPSERAKAYKMKLEAIKRQGARNDLTSDQVGQKLSKRTSRDLIAENSPDSSSQIQRYLRLNELIPELIQMVDEKRIALTPASEISFLSKEEQKMLLEEIECTQATPSLSQAQRMKSLSKKGLLDADAIADILLEQKKPECWNMVIPMKKITKYFPKSYTPKDMEEIIIDLLGKWARDL